jgi:hypothetical protein
MWENQTLSFYQVVERHIMTVSTFVPAPPRQVTTTPFPLAAVEACLRNELLEAVRAEAGIKSIALPSTSADISNVSFHIDSLVVISILCAVEPIIGFDLRDSVVRAGGYESVESALGQLLPRIQAQWSIQKGGTP